jgi:hypothetical protein
MIYFKKPSITRRGVQWKNYMTITEGTDNIDHLYYHERQGAYYVFTKDKKLVKYDIVNKTKECLASNYLERIGDGVRVDEDTVMVHGKLYDGYREVYSDDKLYNKYVSDRWSHHNYYICSTYLVYTECTYNVIRKYYENYLDDSPKWEKEYILGKAVKSLPYKRYTYQWPYHQYNNRNYNGMFDRYIGEDGFLYETDNLGNMLSGRPAEAFVPKKVGNRKIKKITYINSFSIYKYNNHHHNLDALILYEDGDLELAGKKISYGQLNAGLKSDLTCDSELIASTEDSKALSDLDAIRDYILDLYKDYTTSDTMTIILNETVNTSMVMFDYEDDPAYEESMVIDTEHVNPDYFENGLGKDPNVGKGIILNQFKYVGHYLMKARVRDNPVGDDDRFDNYRLWNKDNTEVNVYVHRRPVAKMDYVLSETDDHYILRAWDKESYDLDHKSEVNNGIVAWQWSIKEKDETTWTQYQTKEMTYDKMKSGTTYEVIFKVKDKEGVWSEPVRKEINPEITPIALDASVRTVDKRFRVDQLPITEDYEVYDIVTRYPRPVNLSYGLYDGDTLLTPLETLTQDEGVTGYFKTGEDRKLGQFTWYNKTLKVPKTLADGAYTIKIKATAINNASKSETCILDVGVRTPIEPVPNIEDLWMTGESYELSCRTSIYTDEVIASVFNGSSKEQTITMTLDEIKSEEIDGQVKETGKVWKATCTVAEDLVDGMYNVVFTGRVLTTPSKSEGATASVQVISLKFDEVILSGAWNHWRGQVDLFGKQMDDMPLRFLSWEKVYFTAKTLGKPDKVYVRLSRELEAMSFVDKNGTRFNYKDDFGYEVEFPIKLKEIEDNVWTGEYILPLAHSTLSWEDRRLKPSYEIIVTAEKNGKRVTYEFTEKEGRGIEITGNVTNLIYTQPMPDRRK